MLIMIDSFYLGSLWKILLRHNSPKVIEKIFLNITKNLLIMIAVKQWN